jgi:nicotinamidase-related amidase
VKSTLLVIDMQKVFERGEWHVNGIGRITGNVVRLCRAFGKDTVFTRHLACPDAPGTWQSYNREFAFLEKDPANWDFISGLEPYAKTVVKKHTYSCFHSDEFIRLLAGRTDPSFVIAGVETEFCVLGTVMDAVDAGYPVTLAVDAVGGGKPALTDAVIEICRRMPNQAALKTTDEIIRDLG